MAKEKPKSVTPKLPSTPQTESPTPEVEPQTDMEKLGCLIRNHPPLVKPLLAALQSKRWFITIHGKVKDAPPDDLRHFQMSDGFPAGEREHCLDYVKTMLQEVTAPGSTAWH